MNISKITVILDELNSTNSSNEKQKILSELYSENQDLIDKLFYHVFDYSITFGVTSKVIKKYTYNEHKKPLSIIELLKQLSERTLSGHAAIEACLDFITTLSENDIDTFYKIIDRNLEIGLSIKSINKIISNKIKTFDVVLANSYHKVSDKAKPDFKKDKYIVNRKLDGLRLITIRKNGEFKFFSRKGKEFSTTNKLKQSLISACEKYNVTHDFVLDGELCIVDENGMEDFQSIIKLVHKKDYQIENPRYKVFDYLTLNDFESGVSKTKLLERFENFSKDFPEFPEYLDFLRFETITDDDVLLKWINIGKDSSWEGVMIRKDTYYKSGRSNDLLKVKQFSDAEYIVEDVEISEKPFLNENGLMEKRTCAKSLIITHKGNKVNVGSGLSDTQRIAFYNDKSLIIGKEITVQYFEETKNANGEISLRFPTLKVVYENGRNV